MFVVSSPCPGCVTFEQSIWFAIASIWNLMDFSSDIPPVMLLTIKQK